MANAYRETGSQAVDDGPDTAERELRSALERAFATPSPAVGRISYAHTSVQFSVTGGSNPCTLLLDRRPPVVGGPDEPAEIRFELSPEQALGLSRGEFAMPEAVMGGTVTSHGPVRRYLEVEPIIRGLLGDANPGLRAALAQSNGHLNAGARNGGKRLDPDPDLLAIETRNLHKAFGKTEVLKGANLKIPEGVVSVVLGPSGTGKSVLLQHVIGLMRADDGEVLVRGRRLSKMSRSELLALRTEIGVMFQDGALFSTMNLYDNVAFPLRQHTNLREPDIKEIVLDQLQRVGLSHATHRMPNQLSGGMKKRAGLARALVLEPGIIICDEPDSGLDPVRTALLGDLLIEQHAQLGGTILVITHNIELASRISDHISVLWGGKVIESEMTKEILQSDNQFVRQFLAGETRGPLGMD